ncbi:probable E3 ubiquitin-protein ligase HERC3 isoform X1 [Esox lucius]|uniref:HECT domain-containing protein n=1 Tax=Esox lucius TaxID=8010 RepID=A0A6Q2YAP1_ESOLU|nr:probable E3 ubiquitin-protein ligase HERC3 isoform X1 [Esox lucius]
MFSWGENIRDVFGLGKLKSINNTNSDNYSINFIRTKEPITQIAVGSEVAAFIRFRNDGRQLVSVGRMQEDRNETTWKLKAVDCKEKILSLSCGDAHVILLSEGGSVFCLNPSSSVPRAVGKLNPVIQVACGDQHSIALTKDGEVFAWGKNYNGQLGLGKGKPQTLSDPQHLKSLSGTPLAQITAGGDHSFALSLSGTVFGWGKNSTGQLGLGDTIDRLAPAPVTCLNPKKTILVCCGAEHTAVLTKGGIVFTFGSGRYGQLGHNSLRDELRPRLVAELWGSKVTQVVCGRDHTLAFVASHKKIYSFGRGKQGQLGNGVKIDQSVPLPVLLTQDQIDDLDVELIFAGGNHSFALCSSAPGSGKGLNDSRLRNVTLKLGDETINRWIAECDSKSWNEIKTEIKRIFSSASCLNGSFLDKSRDKHYQTSLKHSGIDLSVVRVASQNLAKKDKVLNEVKGVVMRFLLPSLNNDPIGVEDLRIYLILPELLRVLQKKQCSTDIVEGSAAAILRLNPDKLLILEGLWLTLSESYFRTVVKAFCSVTSGFFEPGAENHCFKSMTIILKVLQRLYDVNSKRHRRLPDTTFHINNVGSIFQTVQNLKSEMEEQDIEWNFGISDVDHGTYVTTRKRISDIIKLYEDGISLLKKYPFVLDTEVKLSGVWMDDLNWCKSFHQSEYGLCLKLMAVGRETLLDDTFQFLRQITCHMDDLKVKFKAENGLDYGGVSLEFFCILANELLTMNPKILEVDQESGLAWFTTDDCDITDEFYFLGMLCGKALYNQCVLNLCFPLALFKKLLGLIPTLDDLKELSPTEASGLQYVLDQDEDVVEDLYLVFMDKKQELIPNGEKVSVTSVNRKNYVDMYVDMKLNKSVQNQFAEFEQGFLKGCPIKTWKMFLPEELMLLLQGEENYEWDKLRENAKYLGFRPTDDIIQHFWNVFTEFSLEQKKTFLTFLTGTDRLPRGKSLSKLQMTITCLDCTDPDGHYPKAQTCYVKLFLPNYSSVDILRKQVLHAITHCEVFGDY